ncbi:CapA family protein [Poseidonibacter lekithochrous]|uniref:CapA family protein n=1 Tax=Poseidonibacter lekithochrous TaxID=1904463 RepID=UPI0013DB7B12|nr:CapA family protein [Poseidonibacter lekithochrous]
MSISLNFVGDISLTGNFSNYTKNIFDIDITNIFKNADYNICNLEGPITDKKSLNKFANANSPQKSGKLLIQYFDIFNLANNHLFDSGIDGYKDTLNEIKSKKYFGAGETIEDASKILYIEKNDIKIGMIAVSHNEGMLASQKTAGVFCEYNLSLLKSKIKEAKQNSDWVILNFHGGEEYNLIPIPTRRIKFKKFLSWGADVIVAHHSHTFQGYEKVKDKIIFYSLGNYIFDIPVHDKKEFSYDSAILNLYFRKEKIDFKFFPVYINKQDGIVQKGSEDFLYHIEQISDFTNYYSKFINDAHRTYFQPNISTCNDNRKIVKNKQKYLKVLSAIYNNLKFYQTRELFIGALVFIILKKLRMVK